MLKHLFEELLQKYSKDTSKIQELWQEVEECYSKVYRHYHTLDHLSHFLQELEEVRHQIKDWDCTLFAMYYHDIVFLPTRNDNEKSSTEVADASLNQIEVPQVKINKSKQMILATKKHERSNDSDTNFFIDADLSIIGSDEETYSNYIEDIKKEYYYLSEKDYNTGRKVIIRRLLDMDSLYKTQYFSSKYEKQARKNLLKELKSLTEVFSQGHRILGSLS